MVNFSNTNKEQDLKEYINLLFPYAYNILGSTDDAKDAVQDVMSNYVASSRKHEIQNLGGYLVKGVINQSINIKNKKNKTDSDRISLPEPVATERADTDVHLRDIASYALLILLEQLSVKERAVFILKEAFSYSHQEIADVLSSTVENSRKLLSRAKEKLHKSKQALYPSKGKKAFQQMENFVDAIRNGDTKNLEHLLSNDIMVVADGGTKVQVVRDITTGKKASINLLLYVFDKFLKSQSVRYTEINHQPAILYYEGKTLISCQVFSMNAEYKICKISAIVDPDKLRHITQNTL
ncbi:sigma-70 family RNA polymerase sigma factor [Fulvivirgaceae bacterium BMA10]|uniref:Sigma-70 family RNA polymerase sigma factor n=1 Tax=Splendidivirga corallicola TaxID=3051826 RepID=A0ABT8KUK3_9BACT|nr:sigma-70 family RNA polymerase sigma factor [Fulvivirgaceae bacterium BMA10]